MVIAKITQLTQFACSLAGYFTTQGSFNQIDSLPVRGVLESEARNLSLSEWLQLVRTNKTIRPDFKYLLQKRLRYAPDGQPYFDLGDERIFFYPDRLVEDEAAVVEGALIILNEAYLQGQGFFSRHVSIAPGDTIFDLGGNLGTSAMLFSRLTGPQGRVYSFEPIFHDLLQRNLVENGIENVEVIAAGVGATSEEVVFAVTDIGIDSRIARPSKGGRRRLSVPMMRLDDFVEQRQLQRVDLIKMDIEGAEELALRGAERVLARFRPKLTIASYHTDPEGEKQHPKLLRLLQEWDYNIEEIPYKHIYAWSN